MIKLKTYIILFVCLLSAQTQQNVFFQKKIAKFNNATDFIINTHFYIVESEINRITQVDENSKILNQFEGSGWGNFSLDYPISIEHNLLRNFVCDYNNHRVLIFDRKLNLISIINGGSNSLFSFPIACRIDKKGLIYILDFGTKSILQFSSNGIFLKNIIGSFTSYKLEAPLNFTIYNDNLIVLDKNSIIFFDIFGNFINSINLDFNPTSIYSSDYLLINTDKNIYIFESNKITELILDTEINNIKKAIIKRNKLYVLTPTNLLEFNLEK